MISDTQFFQFNDIFLSIDYWNSCQILESENFEIFSLGNFTVVTEECSEFL